MALVLSTLVWIAASIHVGVDAHRLKVKHGCLGGGITDMSVTGWVLGVLLLWAFYYPWYIFRARPRYVARLSGRQDPLTELVAEPVRESDDCL